MNFADLKSSILAQFSVKNGNKVVPFIVGRPGGGKSSCAREIAEALAKEHNIPAERIVEFNPSLREPTDILGLPIMGGECSKWLPPEELYALREGTGPGVLIVEELSDATMDMQNPLCRVILDRYAGQMKLSDELFIIATGNRTEDRSGASRLSTKLANRMRVLTFEENVDDWIDWAASHGVPAVLRQFIRWRPNLLSDFDPKRPINPTPRSWEDVSRIPDTLPRGVFFAHCEGAVGSGAAGEYCGFLEIYNDLPDYEEIVAHPDTAPVPTNPSVLYAVVAKIIDGVDGKKFSSMYPFIKRMPPEFVVQCCNECRKASVEVQKTKEFRDFCLDNASLIL